MKIIRMVVSMEVLMSGAKQAEQRGALHKKSHIPQGSVFFEKVIPALLVGMGIVTAALILFAVGVLLGLVRF